MQYVKSKVYTVNCGQAFGQAAMLLSIGEKGYRAVQPNSVSKYLSLLFLWTFLNGFLILFNALKSFFLCSPIYEELTSCLTTGGLYIAFVLFDMLLPHCVSLSCAAKLYSPKVNQSQGPAIDMWIKVNTSQAP